MVMIFVIVLLNKMIFKEKLSRKLSRKLVKEKNCQAKRNIPTHKLSYYKL
jgi:hypothetical protein